MSRDRGGNGIQEVDGSIPFGSTKSNHFRNSNLAEPGEPVISRVSSRVSSSASSSRQPSVSIHSHSALHEEKKLLREADDGSYESNLAHRDSRTTRRADPDDCEVGADGPLPGAEGVRLGSSDSLRPRRSPRSDRKPLDAQSEAVPAAQDVAVPPAARSYRTQRRLVGFSYDTETQLASFSAYVPGSGGRERKRKTVFAATYDDAVRLWTAFRERVKNHNLRPPTAPFFRNYIAEYFDDIAIQVSAVTARDYRYAIDKHLLPFFGNQRLNEITIALVKAFETKLKRHGYALATVNVTQTCCYSLFTARSTISTLSRSFRSRSVSSVGNPSRSRSN
jgi:Phage integrase, N-terminal SAM-like domain